MLFFSPNFQKKKLFFWNFGLWENLGSLCRVQTCFHGMMFEFDTYFRRFSCLHDFSSLTRTTLPSVKASLGSCWSSSIVCYCLSRNSQKKTCSYSSDNIPRFLAWARSTNPHHTTITLWHLIWEFFQWTTTKQGFVVERVGHWTTHRAVATPVPDSKSNPPFMYTFFGRTVHVYSSMSYCFCKLKSEN